MLVYLLESQHLLYLHKFHLNRNLLEVTERVHRNVCVSSSLQGAIIILRCNLWNPIHCLFDGCSHIVDNAALCVWENVDTNRSKYAPRHSLSKVAVSIRAVCSSMWQTLNATWYVTAVEAHVRVVLLAIISGT